MRQSKENVSEQIRKQLMELRRLYKTLTSPQVDFQEHALCACVFYVTRLMDEVLQMSASDMEHEQNIFCKAMLIFTAQFVRQVEATRDLEGKTDDYRYISEKRKRVEDIENAVEKVLNTYRNVIDSTANMDRYMIAETVAGSNAYDLSPKLCAAYSAMLDKLVKVIGEEGKYAFLLNPTLKSLVTSELVLECREEPGEVIVINMPESMAERSDLLPIILVHEAFHALVISDLRVIRAGSYVRNIYNEITQLLMQDTILQAEAESGGESSDAARKVRENLIEKWFSKGKNQLQKYLEGDKSSRQFYGKYLKAETECYIVADLKLLLENLEETVFECYINFSGRGLDKDVNRRSKQLEKADHDIGIFKRNVEKILWEGKLKAIGDLFLTMYREVFADLACVILLGVDIDSYMEVFGWSIKSRMPVQKYLDEDRNIRQYLVAKAYSQSPKFEYTGISEGEKERRNNNRNKWKQKEQELFEQIEKLRARTISGGSALQFSGKGVQYITSQVMPCDSYITEPILKDFYNYFKDVADIFVKRVAGKCGIAQLCKYIETLREAAKNDQVREAFLLSGFRGFENNTQ